MAGCRRILSFSLKNRLRVTAFSSTCATTMSPFLAVDEDGAEDGLLGFEALGWKTVDHGEGGLPRR